MRLEIRDVTVWPVWMDTPRFRWLAPCSHSRYCSMKESLRWYFAVIAATTAGLDGCVPSSTWTALPGAR